MKCDAVAQHCATDFLRLPLASGREMDYDIRMRITPYTPISELRKYVRATYAMQTLFCAICVGHIVLLGVMISAGLSADSFWQTVLAALLTALNVSGVYRNAWMYWMYGNLRARIKYFIWRKQNGL